MVSHLEIAALLHIVIDSPIDNVIPNWTVFSHILKLVRQWLVTLTTALEFIAKVGNISSYIVICLGYCLEYIIL